MDYPCARFGDFSFGRFGFYRADKNKHTDADDRYTHATNE